MRYLLQVHDRETHTMSQARLELDEGTFVFVVQESYADWGDRVETTRTVTGVYHRDADGVVEAHADGAVTERRWADHEQGTDGAEREVSDVPVTLRFVGDGVGVRLPPLDVATSLSGGVAAPSDVAWFSLF